MSSVSKPRVRQNRHKQGLNQTLEKISADFRFNGKEVTVFEKRLPLKDLKYENHRLFFQMGTEAFVLLDGHAPAYVKSDRYLAKENDLIIVIRINRSKHSFTFEDEGLSPL